MELIFTVKKDYLKPKTIGKPAVADSINHLIAVFEFDEAWDGYAKTAVFGNGLDTYGVLLEDDRCTIPWEVLDGSVMSRHFSVSVFGVKDDTRITSSKIEILLEESGYGDFTNSETPSLTICEQIIAKFANYYTTEEADKAVDEKLSSYYTSTQTDELLESKVNTDQYASTTQAGIIKLAADSSGNNMSCIEVGADGSAKIKDGFGIKNAIGKLQIVAATSEMIDAKANPYFPITPSNLDYAVNSVEIARIERLKYYGDPDIVPTDTMYFTFTANSDGVTATVVKNSDVDFDVTDLVIPYKCAIDGKEYIVNTIGTSAFYECSSLTSVIIPDSMTYIPPNAFFRCTSLKSVVIPDSVTSIGDSAFYGCSALKSIEIPYGVTIIEAHTFVGCESLKSIVIPNSVTSVGIAVFWKCTNLKSIILSNNMTTIEGFLFSGCVSLDSIVIPDTVTEIGDSAFYNCKALKTIKIPSSVTYIYNFYAFNGCTNLTIICEQGSYADTYAQENGINVKYDIIDPDAYAEKTTVEELQSTKSDKPTIINYIDAEEVPTSITLENNTVYQFDVISELSIAYPEEISDSFEALIYFSSNETNINFIYPDGSTLETKMSGQDCIDNAFAPVANKRYELSLKWDGKYMNGLVGAVSV